MAPRDSYFTPMLRSAEAMLMAREDWDALVRRHLVTDEHDGKYVIIQAIADAYVASNSSTLRVSAQRADGGPQ